MTDQPALPTLAQSMSRMALRIAVVLLIAYLMHRLLGWVMHVGDNGSVALMGSLLVLSLLAYALLIAVPFVPGIEIGISLMVLRGAEIAPFVYLATLAGLSIAYLAGRFVPYGWLNRLLLDLRLTRASAMVTGLQPLSQDRRLALLRMQLPVRLGQALVNYRYVSLAVLLNLPGNMLLGGGGGICMIAGISRLFAARPMLITLALAVAPVPLLVWAFGLPILV